MARRLKLYDALLAPKPPEGDPCNGCGQCCAQAICPIGQQIYTDAQAPCPGMVYEAHTNQVRCQLIVIEQERNREPVMAEAIGIGKGCCTEDW